MTASVLKRSPAAEFERRAARAELLAPSADAARELLEFTASLSRAQSTVVLTLEEAHARQPFSGRFSEDSDRVVALATAILQVAVAGGPALLADSARTRLADDPATAAARLQTFWNGDITASDDYLSRALLRPYVEVLRSASIIPDRMHRQGYCPFCGGAPLISSRREMADSNAATRVLHCSLCGGEWNVARVSCPSCGEGDSEKLPLFSSEAHPSVRIEACETCSRYVKSLDLTRDARLIPEVDDLVSIAMDLWAAGQGYQRIEPGAAGI